jgi:predicted regulator of Ras-like GTPase activity (Roadblock/LC7/MglB family)
VADVAAAQLAGVAREAERTARLLELGAWRNVAVESPDGHLLVTAPADGALLLTVRGPEVPMGRVARFAERASGAARAWLERTQ